MNKKVKTETSFFKELFTSLFKHKGRRPAGVIHHYFWQAPITATLILINILTFITSLFFSETLFSALINYPQDIFSIRFFSLVTSGFLHANIGHLLGNMLALLIFGRIVEEQLGKKGILTTYFGALLISGILNSLIHALYLGEKTGGLGASGAIMGLVAMSMLLTPLRISYIIIFPLPISIVGWLYIISDVTGLLGPNDGIGHLAHLGGFISVSAIAYFLKKKDKEKMRKGLLINIGFLILLGIIKVLVL